MGAAQGERSSLMGQDVGDEGDGARSRTELGAHQLRHMLEVDPLGLMRC